MNPIEEQLVAIIEDAVKTRFDIEEPGLVMVEVPKNTDYGDYASNIAMRLPKILHRPPREIAQELATELEKHTDLVRSVEIAGPGFINFRLKSQALGDVIHQILEEGEDYGKNQSGQGKRVLVEFVSANPTGILHLGHARGAVWGDVICRLYEASGYDVLREYYVNDAGAQIDNLGKSVFSRYAEIYGEEVPIPEDGYRGEDIKKIARVIADEDGDKWMTQEEGREAYFKDRSKALELDRIKKDLADFRVSFQSWISEQMLYDTGKVDAVIKELKERDLTYEEGGALWFKSSQFGDDKDRVLRKADGKLTYLTPDIANHIYKLSRGYDQLVNLWGADHHGYIARMKAALQAFGYDQDQLKVDIIQMVRLMEEGKEVKMSKRTGNAVTIRELFEDIGVDASRFFFASRAADAHMDFDLTLARKQSNENPVYYVQYAHARTCGVLKKAKEAGWDFKEPEDFSGLKEEKEVILLKLLNAFPDLVADAAKNRMPNHITNYLMQLASNFHSFYGAVKVNDPDHPDLTMQRLALVKAVEIVLSNALSLLAVSAPESM